MGEPGRVPSERYYVVYQRSMVAGLLFVVCLGAYELVKVLRPASGRPEWGDLLGLVIVAAYLVLLLVMQLVTLRGRLWRARDPEVQTILRDEWTLANRSRAFQMAFWVMVWAQVPLMFFMAVVPPQPSVLGMAAMTMALGLGAFFATYLYHSRRPSDG